VLSVAAVQSVVVDSTAIGLSGDSGNDAAVVADSAANVDVARTFLDGDDVSQPFVERGSS
jgi:hypothetical protein